MMLSYSHRACLVLFFLAWALSLLIIMLWVVAKYVQNGKVNLVGSMRIEALQSSQQHIQQELLQSPLQSPVNHFDETGLRVAGKLHWPHNCSNAKFTYLLVHAKHGKKALADPASLIPDYEGWAFYFGYESCQI